MYFVVFLIEAKKIVVIPQTWIHGISDQWKKFINNSINRNQQYLCYYSEETHAQNAQGHPNGNFIPDWSTLITLNAVYPDTGCYYVNLLEFKGNNCLI